MNQESLPPSAPPPGNKVPGKPPYMLIAIGAVVLIVLFKMFSGGSSQALSAGAASSSAAPAGGNPILGTWKLVDTDMASVCRAERVFITYKEATAKNEVPAIYVVNPTYVEVSYGGPGIEEWELHGPNDITLRMISPMTVGNSEVGAQAQSNCRYHRK